MEKGFGKNINPEATDNTILLAVRITGFEDVNNGKNIGYGQIDSESGEAEIGENVFIISSCADMMIQANYRVGSLVMVKVKKNGAEHQNHHDYPWVAVFWDARHAGNIGAAVLQSFEERQHEVLTRARRVLKAYIDMGETATADTVATKAAHDIKEGVRDYSADAILSACGRLRVRLEDLDRKAAADRQAKAERDSFLEEFISIV
jgi:hypothetical protein